MSTRRAFLRDASMTGAALAAIGHTTSAHSQEQIAPPTGVGPRDLARDETYWARIAKLYNVDKDVINLEAGYFGVMAEPVRSAFHRNIDRSNSSFFARQEFPALFWNVHEKAAAFMGCEPTDIAMTRNATEGLHSIIGQYNKLNAGDTVMYADLDYPAMQNAMTELAARKGASVATLNIPEPATHDNIVAAYKKALEANPKTKLLLLTHCNNKTGLLTPVKDVAAIARPRGVDVVVDAAHSFGHVPLSIKALDAEFVGLNFHKWVGAPIGAGAMYIRADKLSSIDRSHGDPGPLTSIQTRLHSGTVNLATMITVPAALDFQASIGIENKAARLRYLRDRWVSAVRGTKGIDVLTPDDPQLVGAITGVRLHGRGDAASNQKVSKTLLEEFRIFTFARTGLAKGDCVRVTPGLYCSASDVDKFADALTKIAARG